MEVINLRLLVSVVLRRQDELRVFNVYHGKKWKPISIVTLLKLSFFSYSGFNIIWQGPEYKMIIFVNINEINLK